MSKSRWLSALTVALVTGFSLEAAAEPPKFFDGKSYICTSVLNGVFVTPSGSVYVRGPNLMTSGKFRILICDAAAAQCGHMLATAQAALLSQHAFSVKVIAAPGVDTSKADCVLIPAQPTLDYVALDDQKFVD